ncbi:MAG: tol-pal system-associated acyl-CoA thioesterase [Formosimonas sp.]
MANPIFELPMKLYFEDTDAMGIVYHANYLKFFERARTEWFRVAGLHHMELAKLGVGFVIRKTEMEWLAPLTLDDEIVATAQVSKMGNASVDLEQTVVRNGQVVCRAQILMVCVDFKSKKPQAVPADIRAIFVHD